MKELTEKEAQEAILASKYGESLRRRINDFMRKAYDRYAGPDILQPHINSMMVEEIDKLRREIIDLKAKVGK